MKIDNLRVHQVPEHMGDCEICDERKVCVYVDSDFRGASICMDDSAFVFQAELQLMRAGLAIPDDSLMDSTGGSALL